VQLARLSGFSPIIALASPASFSRVKALGATHVIDRRLVGSLDKEVAKITTTPVEYGFDAWSGVDSQQALHDVLAPQGRLALVRPKEVEVSADKTVFQVVGIVHMPWTRALGVSLFRALERLLADGAIKVTPPSIISRRWH
jgi:NADPH:quinone reductase-like Zn-dependent oxidoreductase